MTSPSKCESTQHDYRILGGKSGGYYKKTGRMGSLGPVYDQSVAYAMLTCTKCGDQIEIKVSDHRQVTTGKDDE